MWTVGYFYNGMVPNFDLNKNTPRPEKQWHTDHSHFYNADTFIILLAKKDNSVLVIAMNIRYTQ